MIVGSPFNVFTDDFVEGTGWCAVWGAQGGVKK